MSSSSDRSSFDRISPPSSLLVTSRLRSSPNTDTSGPSSCTTSSPSSTTSLTSRSFCLSLFRNAFSFGTMVDAERSFGPFLCYSISVKGLLYDQYMLNPEEARKEYYTDPMLANPNGHDRKSPFLPSCLYALSPSSEY
jgi:hypothetical protein